MSVTLNVCITCRAGEVPVEGQPCAGRRLHDALAREDCPEGVRIVPVECLSACPRGAAVAFSSPGRWTYVYGDMGENDAPVLLAAAAAYGGAPEGLVPWRERAEIIRKRSIARVPPLKDF